MGPTLALVGPARLRPRLAAAGEQIRRTVDGTIALADPLPWLDARR